MNQSYWLITICLFALIMITRALPFILGGLMTERLHRVGQLLPAYIMMLLVLYEIDLKNIQTPPYGLPALMALAVVVFVHVRLRNTFLSLIMGTSTYLCMRVLLTG